MDAAAENLPHQPSKLWRVLKRISVGIGILVVLAAITGASYQAIMSARDARRFPQEGRSVPLGPDFPGVTLSLHCTGTGSPTVILDSGLGVPAAGWDLVQPEVAKFTRVCSYDRAGYGWSSPGPMPRTSSEIVRELHALLTAAGEKDPYILVAHSFGGYNVRVYTAKYPADVAGLVLVDTSHEDQISRMPPSLQKSMKEQVAQLDTEKKLLPVLIFFGVARLTSSDDDSLHLPKPFLDKVNYLQLQTKFVNATASEMQSFTQSADEVRASGNLGDLPLIVLTAGKRTDPKDLPKGMPIDDMQAFQKTWITDLQVQLARLSTRGKQIVVPDSTHFIPFLRPDAVVSAIHEVFLAANAPPPSKP